jgi:hypothetical protein
VATSKGTRWQRVIPLVEVAAGGKPGESMELYLGAKKIVLQRNVPQVVEMPNGSRVEVTQNPKTSFWDFKIQKGVFRFWISGFDCWSAFGLTDQEGSVAWNVAQGAVDVANLTRAEVVAPNREILVRIANRFSAAVNPAVTFQYANIHNCTTFVGSSTGGDVDFFNPDSKQITKIAGAISTFKSGVASSSLNIPLNAITINWEEKTDLNVSGTPGDFKVASNTRKLLRGENGSQIEVEYGASGKIDLKAISSTYGIRVSPLKEWNVRLNEGDGVAFTYEWQTGVFYGWANAENSGPVTFITPEGLTPQVNPGGVITVIGGGQGSVLSRTMGSVVFYEGGGGGEGSAFGAATGGGILPSGWQTTSPFGNINSSIDPSRVPQPPVSVVGGK